MCVPNDVSSHIHTAAKLTEMAGVNKVQEFEIKQL
jgi:hypothetical protein